MHGDWQAIPNARTWQNWNVKDQFLKFEVCLRNSNKYIQKLKIQIQNIKKIMKSDEIEMDALDNRIEELQASPKWFHEGGRDPLSLQTKRQNQDYIDLTSDD